jgi:hypothetical protein
MRERRGAMKRREFFKSVGLPVAAAVGAVIASGLNEPVSARKRFHKSGGGNQNHNQNNSSDGSNNGSNPTNINQGNNKLKMEGDGGSDNNFIIFDDLSK